MGKSQCIWFWCLVWVTCSTLGAVHSLEESDSHSPSFTHRYIISEAGRGSRGQLRTACDLTNRETESQCVKKARLKVIQQGSWGMNARTMICPELRPSLTGNPPYPLPALSSPRMHFHSHVETYTHETSHRHTQCATHRDKSTESPSTHVLHGPRCSCVRVQTASQYAYLHVCVCSLHAHPQGRNVPTASALGPHTFLLASRLLAGALTSS